MRNSRALFFMLFGVRMDLDLFLSDILARSSWESLGNHFQYVIFLPFLSHVWERKGPGKGEGLRSEFKD